MKYLLVFSICFLSLTVFSQTEIELRTDGIVVPRLDASSVSSPTIGQVIYDTQAAQLMYYDGANWMSLSGVFERNGTTVRQKTGYDTDDFVFGRNGLPPATPIISDEMIFFDQSRGAFRGGWVNGGSLAWSEDSLGMRSFAYGESPSASGDYGAVSLGNETKATGDYGATALGAGSVASGDEGATAMGAASVASGENGATALGNNTLASGDEGATALGYQTWASGNNGATALGTETEASGDDGATALGYRTTASNGYGATALGEETTASGSDGATALGSETIASGDYGATALGLDTEASGDNGATAFGYQSMASGNFGATALGESCNASGSEGAIAIGVNTTASGNEGAIAIGNESVANGNEGAVAIGFYAKTYGDKGAASIGWRTEANGRGMTVVGMFNDTIVSKGADTSSISPVFVVGNGNSFSSRSNAFAVLKNGAIRGGDLSTSTWWNQSFLGNSSFAHGKGVVASGIASSAFGNTAQAVGDASFAMGENTVSAAYASLAIGRYNKGSGTPNSWEDGEALFEIGIGSSNIARENAVTVLKNGKVGLGTSTPGSQLHQTYNSSSGDAQIKLTEEGADGARIILENDQNDNRWTIFGQPFLGAASSRVNIHYNDVSGGGTETGNKFQIFGDGDATLEGTLTQNSDRRLKKKIVRLENALALILAINGYSYQWKNDQINTKKQIGVIAQEVQEVLPEIVKTSEEGTLSVSYTSLVPLLIEGMKEQQEMIESVLKENSKLKNEIAEIKAFLKM